MKRTTEQSNALLLTRIIWAALLTGQLGFMFFVLMGMSDIDAGKQTPLLGYIAIGLVIPFAAMAFFIRNQVYKAGWKENVILPNAYLIGNMLFLSVFEGLSFTSLILMQTHGSVSIGLIPSMLAMAIQVINFPHGKPMFSQ